ncbi:hypothetical protein SUDANB145_07254 (plasmid) [Streptomyces sp. enrichment culture]|uniref:hypothetical protein n=1 Tax=Streptomyces sp. enrichment culture TaxID=1795815 RepID=UPI003F548F9D
MTVLPALALLAAGYGLGRWRPALRAFDWAAWQRYGRQPTGLRYAALWVLLSVQSLGWLAAHPRLGWEAWKHRNDPPPPRSPALQFNGPRIPDHTVDEEA